ncbi:MAG: hypothetical protein ABIA59_05025 [Candidatus Latescibacterota bacterium]
MRTVSVAVLCVVMCMASTSPALQLAAPVPLEIGGRFTYGFCVVRDAGDFPWNFASNAAADHTRLMLDLTAGKESYGELFVKGAAWRRDDEDPPGVKRFRFEQGDYYWRGTLNSSEVRLRVFANERRFFTHSLLAPVLDDDTVEGNGDNLGARIDGSLHGRVDLTALYSALGAELENSSRIAYARTAFAHNSFAISTAYLHKDRPEAKLKDLATVKTELSAYYKRASLILTYEQDGLGDGLFLPAGRFYLNDFVGDNFSSILPDNGAFFAEARLAAIPLKDLGTVNFVHRYYTLKKEFTGDFAQAAGGTSGYTTGAYFLANQISANGRLVYTRQVRSRLEGETREKIEASAWACLNNGTEMFLRGGLGKTSGEYPFEDRNSVIHGAWRYRSRKLQSGVHAMWKNLRTDDSERRFAWDAKLALGSGMAVYCRALLSHNSEPRDAVYARFEFRPGQRLFVTASYGRSIFGDAPFLLEDPDIDTLSDITPQYAFSIRGDF